MPTEEFKSKYLFLKDVPKPDCIEIYYCSKCEVRLDFDTSAHSVTCSDCGDIYFEDKLKRNNQFFIHIPLKQQLIDFVNSNLYEICRTNITKDNDIVNSKFYKRMQKKNIIGPNDITLSFNSDGVPLCKSSKMSMWPVQVCVNELPYRIRKKNIMLCMLWYNKVKPPMNMFLEPFINELIDLSENGFQVVRNGETVTVKAHTIVSPVDSVARPIMQNFKQFNGRYGCSYCTQKGKHVIVGKGGARIYKFKRNFQLRTIATYKEYLQKAISGKPFKGIKGPSIIPLIPHFIILLCMPPDYMHAWLLGVIALFASEWFDSKNSQKP